MPKPRRYLEGLLAANVAVAQIVGKLKMGDIQQQTWDITNEIQLRLLEMAAAEAERAIAPEHAERGRAGGHAAAEALSPEERKAMDKALSLLLSKGYTITEPGQTLSLTGIGN